MKRKLTLKSEHLAELTTSDLHSVVGGAITQPLNECVSLDVCEVTNNARCTFSLVTGCPTLAPSCIC